MLTPRSSQTFLKLGSRQLFTLCLVILSTVALSSCGFHLRSYSESASSIKELSLDCPSTSSWELCHHLKQTLLLNDIEITDAASLALTISPMIQKSRVLSLQSNASAAELGLESEVSYSLSSSKDNEIKHQQKVSNTNSYRHETSALLAKDRERDELQMQLSKQLAEEIVRQITVLDAGQWFTPATQDNASQ